MQDFGPKPYVANIEEMTLANENYRTAIWTGENIQMTLMNILPGEDIGLEIHPDHDQFLRVEAGTGVAEMGDAEDNLTFSQDVADGSGIFIPKGTWHNVRNTGDEPLKIYSIYGPAHHAHGTVHKTYAEAMAAEAEEHAEG